jgi:ribosomal protein S18 acetylase RimI-like enzyme
LRLSDVPGALAIQAESYPAFLREEEDAFASRVTLAASYCLAAVRGDAMLGYLLAHGWPRGSPPPVGTIVRDRAPSETLFIHDLSVSSAGRGSGVGRRLIERAFELAARDGLGGAELIAVEGAASYWRTFGFNDVPISADFAAKVANYGPKARWMTREIL